MRIALQPTTRRPMFPAMKASRPKPVSAPTSGWITNANLSQPLDKAALVLDNWFPVPTGIRLRGGCGKYATLGSAVKSMWSYQSGTTEALFAATATDIFDITTVADPLVAPSAAVSSLTGGEWTFVQFETSGGDFLVGVNGADTPREYDGAAWSSSTMTGSGLTTSNLIHVWAYKERLFFIEDGTMRFWYLATGAKTGTLTSFSLAGVFARGGSLMFGGTWSLDSGDGVDDLCVIVSTLGEVAVYQGNNPSDANAWSLAGRYDIAEPLGKNAVERAGGDLLIATKEGIVPISATIRKDPAALSLSAITVAIEPSWVTEVGIRSGNPWTLQKYTERNMMVVGMPAPSSGVEKMSYVVNLESGAWCRFVGTPWDVSAQTVLLGIHYVGGSGGIVYKTDFGGSDDGQNYVCKYAGHPESMGAPGAYKSVNLMRAAFRATKAFIPRCSASVNYDVQFPAAPDSVVAASEDTWDSGLWDTAEWDAGTGSTVFTAEWQAVTGSGYSIIPQVQVTCGITPKPDAELISIDVMFETGAVVV
jgi:hypothetical protein